MLVIEADRRTDVESLTAMAGTVNREPFEGFGPGCLLIHQIYVYNSYVVAVVEVCVAGEADVVGPFSGVDRNGSPQKVWVTSYPRRSFTPHLGHMPRWSLHSVDSLPEALTSGSKSQK